MSLKEISDTSIAISLLHRSYKWYSYIEQRIINIYCNSQIYRLLKWSWGKVKICFRYSFLGRITEAKQITPAVLENSRAVQCLINFYKRWKDKIVRYLKSSLVTELAKDTKEELNFSTVRTVSIIIATSITVNVALYLILQKQIGLWGWLIRGLLLFAAVSGLFCKADWLTIKANSIFLRKVSIN